MSVSDVPNALVRLLEERPEDWRRLADLAVDFAPPHVARAADVVMRDPSADPADVLDAIHSVPALVLEDTPLAIGSIEPETLDFAPVSTIMGDIVTQEADIELDFGAGTDLSIDILDQSDPAQEHDEPDADASSTEFDHALTPDRLDALDDDVALGAEDGFEDDFDDFDDGDDLDVGE